MKVRRNPKRIARNITLAIIGIVLILATGLGIWLYVNRDRNPLPKDIRPALTFSPLVIPKDHDTYKTAEYIFNRAEDDTQVLAYTVTTPETKVAVSQYSQPIQFSEIPEYKDRFLTNVVQQSEVVQTANGAIYVGSLTKQEGKQIGVMLEKGLIVFMRPEQTIDAAAWRRLGEALEVQRIN